MVPFTPCTCVCFEVKSMVRFTPCMCDQIHGPIYTQPVLVIKSMVPFTPCICVCFGVKCMVPFTPYPFVCFGVKFMLHGSIYTLYLCLFWGQIHGPIYSWNCDQIHGPIYTQPVLVIKSMVSFTPCICVCFGVKCLVPFTPLYFCLLWG